MKLAVFPVWLLVGILASGVSARAQSGRGGFGISRGGSAGPAIGATASQGQNRPAGSGFRSNPPSRAGWVPGNQTQFLLPSAGSAQPRSIQRFGLFPRPGDKFGIGHFDHRRWIDFRRHLRFRHLHSWRGWHFVPIYVPGFIGTAGYYGAWAPWMTWNGWAEQGLPEYYPGSPDVRGPDRLAPFDPTPQDIVERVLALASVSARDVVYDLGAGDGRVVIAAAKNYGAKAIGFEVEPGLVKLARENVRRDGVEHLVEIRQQDFMTADLSPATVVTLYLSYDGNLALRPKLLRELKEGARVVSYTFDMAEWQPKVVESIRNEAGEKHMLYMWQMSGVPVFSN